MTRHTYLFMLTDDGGTVPPELGVARRLVDRIHRVHRVTVLADDGYRESANRPGAAALCGAVDSPWPDELENRERGREP